ncbi:MAG: DNA primase DnaG [archaeon]
MAKISPVSIKYMIHVNFSAEGALEKPDVIGAIFGQTEGLLGAELEMRELQKEGKIGRIEVELERNDRRTTGKIKIPTALDQSETTLIAAAVETIERIGPCDSQLEVERIEDVRGSKRDYILDRAKKLMGQIHGSADSREISNEIKDSAKTAGVKEFGKDKLPCGDLSGKEVIIVEGRADVLNLLRNGINNAIAMNGTKLNEDIIKLGDNKELTLFIDGDRGGRLIAQNVADNAKVKYIAVAPDGKEVEELTGKEIWMQLRKKIPVNEFFNRRDYRQRTEDFREKVQDGEIKEISDEIKEKLKKISEENSGTGKAIFLDEDLNEIKSVSAKGVGGALRKDSEKIYAIVVDGAVTGNVIKSAEDSKCQAIVAKNFAASSDKIKLLSF